MVMGELTAYISPELMILIVPLYILGMFIKRAEFVPNKFIPLILGGIGIIICLVYEFITLGLGVEAFLTGIVQGILLAGVTVYSDQIKKQFSKLE